MTTIDPTGTRTLLRTVAYFEFFFMLIHAAICFALLPTFSFWIRCLWRFLIYCVVSNCYKMPIRDELKCSFILYCHFYNAFYSSCLNLRSVNASTAHIAVVGLLQSSCEWRSCQRSLHSNCLGLQNLTVKRLLISTHFRWEGLRGYAAPGTGCVGRARFNEVGVKVNKIG